MRNKLHLCHAEYFLLQCSAANSILLTCSKLALSNDFFFKSKHFKFFYLYYNKSISLDPDEDQFAFSPDLTPNCLCSGRQNLPLAVLFNTQCFLTCTVKPLIWQCGCAVWSESLLGWHAKLYILLWCLSCLWLSGSLQSNVGGNKTPNCWH